MNSHGGTEPRREEESLSVSLCLRVRRESNNIIGVVMLESKPDSLKLMDMQNWLELATEDLCDSVRERLSGVVSLIPKEA